LPLRRTRQTSRREKKRFFAANVNVVGMPMSHERCSFEVVYKKNAEGLDVIEHVVVRTGLSDASVTLTISQVYNLARLLNIVQQVNERTLSDAVVNSPAVQALPRIQSVHSE
jgi:hypothetical protein